MKHRFPLILALCALFVPILPATGQQFPANASPVLSAGAPSNGTSEIQTLTIGGTPTAGSIRITFDGHQTGVITWSATNATLLANINAALDALPNLENGEVVAAAGSLTAGIGTITLTFGGNRAKLAVNLMTVANSLTGTSPTAAITETTPGVTATGRSSAKGRLLIDATNAILYQNTGTPLAPTWTQIGPFTELATVLAAIPTVAVADLGAVTVGADIAAFTDPPSAAEMALLRTFVNALKADAAADRAKINDLLAKLRTAGIVTP